MKVIINPKYNHLYKEINSIPASFEETREIIYDGRNTLKQTYINDISVVIKRFKKPHIINRIAYSFFRKSKAARSFFYSLKLKEHGFETPEPIAMIEQYDHLLLTHSYYICLYNTGETVRPLMENLTESNQPKLKAFARYTVKLHQAGILHLDYSPGNILINKSSNGNYTFSLIDINRMKFYKRMISQQKICKSMRRLCTSHEVLSFIMSDYASLQGWDINKTISLSIHYTNNFFKSYIYRRATRKEKTKHIIIYIMIFRMLRFLRSVFPSKSSIFKAAQIREKKIYDNYLKKYDFQKIFSEDYA